MLPLADCSILWKHFTARSYPIGQRIPGGFWSGALRISGERRCLRKRLGVFDRSNCYRPGTSFRCDPVKLATALKPRMVRTSGERA